MAAILAFVDDLFFQAKMMETAKQAGVEVKSFSSGDALLAEMDRQEPKLVVVDLNARQAPLEMILRLRASDPEIPIIGFLSHVQTEMAIQAREAGCTEVMPRSKFSKELSTIFSRAKF